MNSNWPLVSLDELIRLERRPVEVKPEQQYQEIGIYCFGRGIFHKTPRTGLEVGDKNLYELREGDLILQVTFAWEGAIALCSKGEQGFYGSTRYPTFRVDETRCFAPFLLRYLGTRDGLDQINKICPGSAGRNRVLSLKRLHEVKVPLLPVSEQRRIVVRIEELAAKINEASGLRINAANETSSIIRSAVTRIDQDLRSKRSVAKLEDFASGERGALRSGPFGSALLHSEFVFEGIPAIGIQDVQENRFKLTRRWNVTPEKAEELRRYTIKPRDILVTVMGTLGRACVVPDDIPRMVSTKHVWTVTLDQTRAEPKWVSYWLNFSSLVCDELLGQGTGTAIPGLNGEKIRALSLPDIPLLDQQHIVAELDALQAQVDGVKKLQAETAAELDALLPSILDKAFKGELEAKSHHGEQI
jgi:type I restriction enzyme S subunit